MGKNILKEEIRMLPWSWSNDRIFFKATEKYAKSFKWLKNVYVFVEICRKDSDIVWKLPQINPNKRIHGNK